jgi:hypothetical protein
MILAKTSFKTGGISAHADDARCISIKLDVLQKLSMYYKNLTPLIYLDFQ